MPRGRRVRTVNVAPKRLSVWVGINVPPIITAAAGIRVLATLNAAALALRPFTVVRSRFIFTCESDQFAAAEDPFGNMGFIVANDTASVLGVTALPDPTLNPDSDWFVYQSYAIPISHENELTGGGVFYNDSITQYSIDSKAMRKVDSGDDIAVLLANDNAGDGVRTSLLGRLLVKLH